MFKKIIKKTVRLFHPQLFQDPPIDISDEAVNWLCFANAGILERGNLYSFDHAIANLPEGGAPILEIGSFCGLSTNLLSHYKTKHNVTNKLINCDKWQFEGARPGEKIAGTFIGHSEYKEFVRDTYLRNVRMFSRNDLPYTIELLSDEFFELWINSSQTEDIFGRRIQLGGPLSFCYIDGNHSYEFVKRDYEHCDHFLLPGGFLLFDDSADGSAFDVVRVVQEVKASGRYETVIKNPNYLFRKKS
jgi:hypothetical protein